MDGSGIFGGRQQLPRPQDLKIMFGCPPMLLRGKVDHLEALASDLRALMEDSSSHRQVLEEEIRKTRVVLSEDSGLRRSMRELTARRQETKKSEPDRRNG